MRQWMQQKILEKGFTLIEVIVTITVAAILASIVISFMGTAIKRSADPIWQAQDLATAEDTMEKIAADYGSYLATGSPNWLSFKTTADAYPQTQILTVPSGDIYRTYFETVEVTVTVGDHTLMSYFAQ